MNMHIYTHSCTHIYTDLTSKRGLVGQSEGLLILRSSVRFRLNPENTDSHGFEVHRPSVKGTKLLLKVIKAVIILHVFAHLHTGRKSQQQRLNASNNIIDTHTHPYICMHIHIYMHIHICAQPAANVSQMFTLMSKEHLYNAYSCTCTGAQNTCKVHATLIAHIYIYTHMHTQTYPQEYTCATIT